MTNRLVIVTVTNINETVTKKVNLSKIYDKLTFLSLLSFSLTLGTIIYFHLTSRISKVSSCLIVHFHNPKINELVLVCYLS